MSVRQVSLVFAGGGIGAGVRAVLLTLLAPLNGPFPLVVLLINIVGAGLLGIVYTLAGEAGLMQAGTRLFVAVGLLGGFTTFSTFGWGVDRLMAQAPVVGTLYVGVSVVGGLLAAIVGLVLGRELITVLEPTGGNRFFRLMERRRDTSRAVGVERSEEIEDQEETALGGGQ